ncbi:MAG: hypothetical protein HOE90_02790 [Bacteriovoracaceae bacterium]|jgi:hypothetical protein|nr:hypothetical protein [Bacteriovoracaceae bacterium]
MWTKSPETGKNIKLTRIYLGNEKENGKIRRRVQSVFIEDWSVRSVEGTPTRRILAKGDTCEVYELIKDNGAVSREKLQNAKNEFTGDYEECILPYQKIHDKFVSLDPNY